MIYVWLYLTVLVNLSLGLFLGWHFRMRGSWQLALPLAPSLTAAAPQPAAVPTRVETESSESAPIVETFTTPFAASQELPGAWLEMLDGATEVKSFVEASVKVLKLEVGRYRDRLVGLEEETRLPILSPDELTGCLQRLEKINADWLERQAEASGFLQDRRDGMGQLATIGQRLEDVLANQTAQIESTVNNLRGLDPQGNAEEARSKCVAELLRLLGLAHELRDVMADTMASILGAEGRLGVLKGDSLTDELTGVFNRTAEERKLWELKRDDPNHVRTVSFGMIDLDSLGRLNSKLGTMQVDGVLAATGRLMQSLIRTDRGDDAMFRHSGQRFGFFFGDTGPHAATGSMEKIRQTLEATTFHCGSDELPLTVSCAVTEVRPGDSIQDLLTRAERTVRSAKSAGRNCTMLDAGEGPSKVDPPQYRVKPRVIELV